MPKTIPFKSSGPKKDSKDGVCVDHGEIGKLKYEVYKRGGPSQSAYL